ncbi:hypothetical protein B484DRAFT_411895 [Ochromonadaceae sp. CCMP2298]|nr:hypothetical protein B484DRAFT_411895 [Ochromonadaceae sp. CCMP2298]
MWVLQLQLQRLFDHPGFPTGSNLSCPVFTQDKFRYIAACADICNPTMKIEIAENGRYENIYDDVMVFTGKYTEGCGWVLKTPFTTNSYYGDICTLKYPRSLLEFASAAVANLGRNSPSAVVDGLIRVDIFMDSAGRHRVNEFESLEANIHSSGSNVVGFV